MQLLCGEKAEFIARTPAPRHSTNSTPLPIENLQQRLAYIDDVLGLKIIVVAFTAGLSEKVVRRYREPDWNPTIRTALALDITISQFMPHWIEAARRARDGG